MTTDETLAERLNICREMEETAAQIYHTLRKMFPEDRSFWHDMALEEENHASVLTLGKRFHSIGKSPGSIVPESERDVRFSLDLAKAIKKKINGGISQQEALELALNLEEAMAEKYFNEAMNAKADSKIMSVLKKMAIYSEAHMGRLKEFMGKKGIPMTKGSKG